MKETRLTNEQALINRGYPKSRVQGMLAAVPPEVLRNMDKVGTLNQKLAIYYDALAEPEGHCRRTTTDQRMSFIYFIPGEDNNSVDIKALGLEYAFDKGPHRGMNRRGFDGETQGAVLVDQDAMPASRCTLKTDEQVWRKIKNYHIGYWKDSPPTEESLRRPIRLAGRSLQLGGEDWQVPVAISFEDYQGEVISTYQLSQYVDCDEDGEPVLGDVEERFAPLMEQVLPWVQAEEFTLNQLWKVAANVLSYNYRVSVPELAMLKLLTTDVARNVLDICTDVENLARLQAEKKTSTIDDVTTTNAGEQDAEQGSSQQLQTSS